MATVMLKGSENIYAAISVDATKQAYKEGTTRAGQTYYRGRWGNRGFTCGKDFLDAYESGTLEQVSFSETTYVRTDPITGDKVDTPSATLGGFLTKEKVVAMLRGEKELVGARAQLKAFEKAATKYAEKAAYVELGVPADEIKELMALLG